MDTGGLGPDAGCEHAVDDGACGDRSSVGVDTQVVVEGDDEFKTSGVGPFDQFGGLIGGPGDIPGRIGGRAEVVDEDLHGFLSVRCL